MIQRNPKLQRARGACEPIVRGCCITDSASTSEANQETHNSDLRVVGGTGSTNVSALNSTVQVLDAGAINKSYSFAKNALDASMQSVDRALSNVQEAYSTAKAGEQRVLVAAGMMIVGVVALKALNN